MESSPGDPGKLRIVVVDDEPDTVISDIAMPGVSGWDVSREVRKIKGQKRPLLIAVSGIYAKNSDKLLAGIAGYNFYLIRPCDPNVLLTLVKQARRD